MVKVIRWLDKNFEETIMICLLTLMCVIMFVQVILRYFFGNSLSWAEELCRFMFVWFACMGFATGVKHHEDLRVDSIYTRAPKALKIIMDIITTVCMFIFCFIFIYGGIAIIKQQVNLGIQSSSMGIPMYLVTASLFFGVLFMLLRMIQNLIKKQRL